MIQAGIIGATGYAGSELLRLLTGHPGVEVAHITSRSYENQPYGNVYASYSHRPELVCDAGDIGQLAEECDVIFLALPHGLASGMVTERILERTVVIDLGADFRLTDCQTYKRWYGAEHHAEGLLPSAVYGLCELHRERVRGARLVANPGCYTTCAILSLYPLLEAGIIEPEGIVIDAKSGVSGAGREISLGMHFCETNENFKAYKVASHRHTPEIEEQLSLAAGRDIIVQFTPHLVPANRGILATCYGKLRTEYAGATHEDIMGVYAKRYGGESFVRLTRRGVLPETRWVKGSNFMDIGFEVDARTGRVIVVGALDNLIKGAAGQAVQNMNIIFGLKEDMGLEQIPMFPA